MSSTAGRTLGRYRLERLVGRGGMAEVWEARDQVLGRRVAVKIILPNLAADARFHERFLSEARSVAALEHPHVLPIYDFGEAEGEPFLVMPFLDGGTLAERLSQGAVAIEQAIDWIRQIASALDAAHAAGVLHRDIKPANVMVGASGRLLLGDFGIAKAQDSGQLTATGIALGTPAYMAPELARGEAATERSDRYALGVVAYELLCGRPPFAGDNALALLHQHLTTPVPAVRQVRPDLPLDLDPAFAAILAKEPAERPTSCAALAETIARAFGRTTGETAASSSAPRHAQAGTGGREDATLPLPVTPTPSARATRDVETRADAGPRPAAPAAGPAPPGSARSRGVPARIAAAAAVVAVAIVLAWTLLRAGQTVEPDEEPDGDAAIETSSSGAAGSDDATTRPGDDGAAVAEGDVASDRGADDTDASSPQLDQRSASDASEGIATDDSGLDAPSRAAAAGRAFDAPAASPQSERTAADTTGPAITESESAANVDAAASVGAGDPLHAADDRLSPGRQPLERAPAAAIAIFDLIEKAWRRGRFTAQLFADVERQAAALEPTPASADAVAFLRTWIAGGQALAAGDRDEARDRLRSLSLQRAPEWAVLPPARFLASVRRGGADGQPAAWQVALFWGDPRREARALLDAALDATPSDRALLLGRAVVTHLDGDHDEAARQAAALEPLFREREARSTLVRFTGDQLLWSGDVAGAVSWYKKLLEAPERIQITAVLRTLTAEGGPALIARACGEGFGPACPGDRLHPSGQRARRARRQP